MIRLTALFVGVLLSLWGAPALAQQTSKVVSTCGTASYTAGTTNYNTVDVNGNQCGANGGGAGSGSAVYGPTAVGSAAATPPVLTGGTVDGSGTGNVSVWKIIAGLGQVQVAVSNYTLLTGATSSGSQTPASATYALNIPAALNGATITFTATPASGAAQTYTYTAAPASPPIFNIYAGTTVVATAAGGTPTGNTTLSGGPTSPGVNGSTSATNTAPVSIQQTTTTSAVQFASNALTNGAIFEIPSTDTGTVCVGPAGVTTSTGYCMSVASGITAGSLGVNNTSLMYVIGTNTSDKLFVLGN